MIRWHPTASLHPRGHLHIMVCVLRILPLFFSLVVGFVSVPAHASVIKKSNSGLCHPPQSSWYERTQNYQPTTPLMPVWIQVVNYQMESLLHRFDRPRSSKAGYVAMNGLRLVTVGMMLKETVRTAVLRHWLPNPQPTSGLQTKVVVGWSQADGSVRSQARSSRTAARLTLKHVVPLKWALEARSEGLDAS